jgi:hypothetical protein
MAAPAGENNCLVCAQPGEKLCRCGTRYCSITCQTLDWKEKGHNKVCRRLARARKGDGVVKTTSRPAAPVKGAPPVVEGRPAAPVKAAPPVVAGPIIKRADVERAKAAAATAAAASRGGDLGSDGDLRCPVCFEDWDPNAQSTIMLCCCCNKVCADCDARLGTDPCPLCRAPIPSGYAECLARLRKQAANDSPAAIGHLGRCYVRGDLGLKPSLKKAARLCQRAADLGDRNAMLNLGTLFMDGSGVKLDRARAVRYFRAAAESGLAKAQHVSGVFLFFTSSAHVARERVNILI